MLKFKLMLPTALLLSLTACIGGSTPPSEFYLLEPLPQAAKTLPSGTGQPLIALAPVRIPQYLDRPQMVSATGKNAYKLSELNRWAERLDDNIARVLAQNLSALVPAELVLTNASSRTAQAKFRVSVTILEFHVDPQAQAVLSAQWTVTRGEAMPVARQARYQAPAAATDYHVMAGALNECLNRLSRDMAESLRGVLE